MTEAASRPLPKWFDDAKFGAFITWTAAAIPAYAKPANFAAPSDTDADWDLTDADAFDSSAFFRELPFAELYQNTMHIPGSPTAEHHAKHYGDLTFDDFVAQFRAGLEHWDPEPWVDLFVRAGVRYVILVTKHLDGFLLWPSPTKNPYKENWQAERDIVSELADAVRARGLKFGIYYDGGLDFTFGGLPFTDFQTMQDGLCQTDEYVAYVDAHWRELIEKHKPSIIWNDMAYPPAADPEALINWYRELVPDGVSNNRFAAEMIEPEVKPYADYDTLEFQSNYERDAPKDRKWESIRGIGSSFGFNRAEPDADHTSTTALIQELVDATARGGNLLLSVGVTAAGRIPWAQSHRLVAIGQWLEENGDAIYDTRPWTRQAGTTSEGLEVRYTECKDAVHAIVLGTPSTIKLGLDVRLDAGAEVRLEGGLPLDWSATANGIEIELPEILDEQPARAFALSPPTAVHAD